MADLRDGLNTEYPNLEHRMLDVNKEEPPDLVCILYVYKSKSAVSYWLTADLQNFPAERTRFELVVGLLLRQFSKLVVSATHPPLLVFWFCECKVMRFCCIVQIFCHVFFIHCAATDEMWSSRRCICGSIGVLPSLIMSACAVPSRLSERWASMRARI